MLKTYRTWKDTKETFFIADIDLDDMDMFCEAPYYEESYWFDEVFIKKESREATKLEILDYIVDMKKYGN